MARYKVCESKSAGPAVLQSGAVRQNTASLAHTHKATAACLVCSGVSCMLLCPVAASEEEFLALPDARLVASRCAHYRTTTVVSVGVEQFNLTASPVESLLNLRSGSSGVQLDSGLTTGICRRPVSSWTSTSNCG